MAVRFSADGQDYTRALGAGALTSYTISCWVRIAVNRPAAFSTAWCIDDGNTSNPYAVLQAGGTNTVDVWVGVDATGSSRTMTVGVWYWWAVAVNGTNWTVISRAATDTSFTVTSGTGAVTPLTNSSLRLGESLFTDEWINGNLAAVKFWTGAALTTAELQQEAWTYLPYRTANIRAWYPLTRAETVDYSGQGNTLSGGTGATTEDGPPIAWRRGQRRARIPLGTDVEAAPAALAAPWQVPAPAISTGVNVDQAPILAPWQVPTPDVSTTGSPPTQVQPSPIVAPWAIPAPAVRVDVTVHAAPIVAAWTIPGPDVTVPINPGDDLDGPGQLSLNGFKMGGGTAYHLVGELVGADIDLPAIDEGDVPNPSSDGDQPGRSLSQARYITASFQISVPRGEMREVMEAFRDNTPAAESDEELDLAIQVLDTIYVTRGKVVRRTAQITKNYRLGLAQAVLQVKCTDPRLYSKQLGSTNIADGQTIEVTNLGNRRTRPTIRVPGPAISPRLEIWRLLADGTEDLRVLEFNIEIDAGDMLTIDVTRGTAELLNGSSQTSSLTGSVALTSFVLGRGVSEITYETSMGTAPPITVLWRHAWL